ncbi:MAG TPA: hypothetical protein V6D02_11730 [Candidatus Obscuribacterales bacterium]
MITLRLWPTLAIGTGLALLGLPARAQVPNLYYSWRSLEVDVATCLDRSTTALTAQSLGNIQVQDNSVAGFTEEATAVFVCLGDVNATTVMLMVSSNDDDVAFNLREILKASF